ncbi:hypothetical protein HK097_006641 [Rhizophlyctis rosea]|uniref:Phytanoyl-CoA dioxygenase n=1 Tax=Rhizophlyctis rosea TaxID=64517 RepID=A0AAD5SE00_9FUNG|nr:hypothetical protein HK097_006641 [Rhizophlyctis rosea]
MSVTAASPDATSPVTQAFQRNGYHIARALLSPKEVATIRDTFMETAKNGPVEGLSSLPTKLDPNDPLSFYPRMMHPHTHPSLPVGPLAEKYLLDPRIESILKECLGEQPIAVQTMFYFKPPGSRGQTLHQDNYYLKVRPKTCCAAWIALDDADAENGGMSVVPGTQDLEIACPEPADLSTSFTTEFVRPPEGLVPRLLDLKAGDVLFFNGSVVHGSTPNTSKERFRRALICHYVPESTEELSHWYFGAIRTFDGSVKDGIRKSTWGGPCGTDAGHH